MGTGHSTAMVEQRSSPEELSHLLAHRFASKCFTPLELAHLKDNFDSRALDESGLRHWNEDILSRFLGIPDGAGGKTSPDTDTTLDAGPVIFRMVSYLGAFPFQNTQAPSVLTYEAIVKVVVLLTERYGRVLKRGKKDRIKLLFGSLADVGRAETNAQEKPTPNIEKGETDTGEGNITNGVSHHAAGFAIDVPAHDEEEDDDDDLALAALESLDAIEVFKHDQRIDRSVYKSRVSVNTFRRLLALLLVIAPLHPLATTSKLIAKQNSESIEAIQNQVDSILAAFGEEVNNDGITYKAFSTVITTVLPFVFDPLTPLFEHFLFSKNLNLSRRKESRPGDQSHEKSSSPSPPHSPQLESVFLPGHFESSILNTTLLSHLSFFLSTSHPIPNLFRNGSRLHPIFSSVYHGESLTAFSHHVLTWQAPSLLLVKGVTSSSSSSQDTVLVGAHLPEPWKQSTTTPSSRVSNSQDPSKLPCLFQLLPTHTILQAAPSFKSLKSNMPVASFSTKSGIALGCMIPPSSRTSLHTELHPRPAGGGSLIIDPALENATFVVSRGLNGDGVFLPPGPSPSSSSLSVSTLATSNTTSISIHTIEVWGIVPSQQAELSADLDPESPKDAVAMQRAMWNFEAREAERRRTIHLNVGGGDSETQSGRALLEMAGIIGDAQYGPRRH
ncbi:Restriction of telomere capping protein 5 [Emydomyces testavorans]|uniref:Restriction of telomere capping protein 5 n=1 Tax=Emydomyces testavorans TaxID=2070801 RepID=A0AAF0DM36_9EURO|nr:Restriction of telomere capping protein 5 [Emydomyces testavorans]